MPIKLLRTLLISGGLARTGRVLVIPRLSYSKIVTKINSRGRERQKLGFGIRILHAINFIDLSGLVNTILQGGFHLLSMMSDSFCISNSMNICLLVQKICTYQPSTVR